MDKKALKWIIIVVVVLTLISFITPWLFTRPAFCDCLVFEGKGEIGDVIGGIWGSAIALIGVGVTFLAFWIQKKANDIQIAQFKETQDKDKQQKDTEAKNRVELMREDIRYMVWDLQNPDGRIAEILKFKEAINANPYQCNVLMRSTLDFYERIKSTPRMDLFAALSRMSYEKPNTLIYSFFNATDFLFTSINDTILKTDKYSKDIYEYSRKICDVFQLDEYQLISSISGFYRLGYIAYIEVEEFLSTCNKEFFNKSINVTTDVAKLVSVAEKIQPIITQWPGPPNPNSTTRETVINKLNEILKFKNAVEVATIQQIELIDTSVEQFDVQIEALNKLEEKLNDKL